MPNNASLTQNLYQINNIITTYLDRTFLKNDKGRKKTEDKFLFFLIFEDKDTFLWVRNNLNLTNMFPNFATIHHKILTSTINIPKP